MKEIEAQEASVLRNGGGIIALPRYGGRLHGRIERQSSSPVVVGGYLLLSGGRRIPWTPANKIGWKYSRNG